MKCNYVLLQCGFDPDENFIDNSYVASGDDIEKLVQYATKLYHPHVDIFVEPHGHKIDDNYVNHYRGKYSSGKYHVFRIIKATVVE